MTPREVIARAIWSTEHGGDFSYWAEYCAAYFSLADAVIDALEGMEVTRDMAMAYYVAVQPCDSPEDEVELFWRAMVGAMRDE